MSMQKKHNLQRTPKDYYTQKEIEEKANKGIVSKDDRTDILKKGSVVTRFTTNKRESIDDRRKYASILKNDVWDYKNQAEEGMFGYDYDDPNGVGIYEDKYVLSKDAKIATAKVVEDELLSLYGNESADEFVKNATNYNFTKDARDFVDSCSGLSIGNLVRLTSDIRDMINPEYGSSARSIAYRLSNNKKIDKGIIDDLRYVGFAEDAVNSWAHSHLAKNPKDIDKRLIQKGYDACIDYEDYAVGQVKYPLIFLNPKDSLEFYKQVDILAKEE